MYYNKKEKGETPTVKDGIRKDVFYREKNLKTGSFAFRRRIDTDCTDRLLAQRQLSKARNLILWSKTKH